MLELGSSPTASDLVDEDKQREKGGGGEGEIGFSDELIKEGNIKHRIAHNYVKITIDEDKRRIEER